MNLTRLYFFRIASRMTFAGLMGLSAVAFAQPSVTIKDAWVRATVAQQKATGLFMSVMSPVDATLVSARSAAAGVVEVHEMSMDNGVMKMRQIPGLALPAGKVVELKSGGYHVMLMDLKAQVKVGDVVPVTLTVKNKDGKITEVDVKAVARPLTESAHKHHH